MSDLVIGGRKLRPQHSARSAVIVIALGVAVVIAGWFVFQRAVSYKSASVSTSAPPLVWASPRSGSEPRVSVGNADLSWLGEVPVVRASGNYATMYQGVGRLLGPTIEAPVRSAGRALLAAIPRGGAIAGLVHGLRFDWRYRLLDDALSVRDLEALAGMVHGARGSRFALGHASLLRAQAVVDIGAVAREAGEPNARILTRSLTLRVAQGDAPLGRVWVARSLAFPGLDDGPESAPPVVLIAKPDGRIAWAGVTIPGSIGVLTGVNAEGIAITVNPATTKDGSRPRVARPLSLIARDVLEQCASLEEAIQLLGTSSPLGSASIAIFDGRAGSWAVVERTPTKSVVLRNPTSPVVGDLFISAELTDDPQNDRARRNSSAQARMRRAGALAAAPLADVGAVASLLADRRSVDGVVRPRGHRGIVNDAASHHVAIIDPVTLVMWVAPHAESPFRALDLRHELLNEGTRSAPPADLLAQIEAGASTIPEIREARRYLRSARAALADGNPTRALESAVRALGRAPELPESLEWMARIALARGDRDSARTYFDRWLERGVDAPGSAEELRGVLGR